MNRAMLEDDPEYVGEDRLSSLPLPLLLTILSLLPIHSAAATSLVSRHMRYLWTHISRIYIRFPYNSYRRSRFQTNIATVAEIVAKLDSPIIRIFDLKLSLDLSFLSVSSSCLVSSLQHICLRNPMVVKVNLGGINTYFFPRFCEIPTCVFQTQSLIKLHLQGNLYFGFCDFDPAFITLPNLEKLALDLSDDLDLASFGPLFATCPLLQDLKLTLYFKEDNDIVVDLSLINNLKFLLLDVMAPEVKGCVVVIDAPNLEEYRITGDLALYDFARIPSNLQKAVISITETSFGDDNDYITMISGLIQGISYVKCLYLVKSGLRLLDSITHLDVPPPIFHNLSTLTIHIDRDGWIGELPGSYFLGNLKSINILDVACQDVEINLVQHILTNATVLEELLVCVRRRYRYLIEEDQDQHQKDYEFCVKLFMLPKSSVNCQIIFSGTTNFALSEDFKDGVVTFRQKDDYDWDSDYDSDDTVESNDTV